MRYIYNRRVGRHQYYDSRTGRYFDNPSDNAGQIGIDSSGDPTIGIGSGLGIDLKNGDLTVQVAPGFSIDLGPDNNDNNPGF